MTKSVPAGRCWGLFDFIGLYCCVKRTQPNDIFLLFNTSSEKKRHIHTSRSTRRQVDG
jgi:hypothetical protein